MSLPERNCEMCVFVSFFFSEVRVFLQGIYIHLLKNCFFVCYSPVGVMNSRPTDYKSWLIWESVHWMAVIKVGVLDVWPSFQGEADVLLLEEAGGRLQKNCPLAFSDSLEDPSQHPGRWRLIRRQILRQQLWTCANSFQEERGSEYFCLLSLH